jgi:hypothetical protein
MRVKYGQYWSSSLSLYTERPFGTHRATYLLGFYEDSLSYLLGSTRLTQTRSLR